MTKPNHADIKCWHKCTERSVCLACADCRAFKQPLSLGSYYTWHNFL